MVQFASYLRRVLCKTRLIFSRINGPNELRWGIVPFLTATTISQITQFLLNFIGNFCFGGRSFVKRLPLKKIGKP